MRIISFLCTTIIITKKIKTRRSGGEYPVKMILQIKFYSSQQIKISQYLTLTQRQQVISVSYSLLFLKKLTSTWKREKAD